MAYGPVSLLFGAHFLSAIVFWTAILKSLTALQELRAEARLYLTLRQKEGQRKRERGTVRGSNKERERKRERGGQTDRQTDRQTDTGLSLGLALVLESQDGTGQRLWKAFVLE